MTSVQDNRKKEQNHTGGKDDNLTRLNYEINHADAVIIGAGAGLSTSAGFIYNGERFRKYFGDFAETYQFDDMYSGGFYPYPSLEEMWAYWSRYIYINRYMDPPKPVYERLLGLVRDKDYFVITTNVDHCFQKAGFDKERLFYTQGDYGLWQCSKPCHGKTYDNEEQVRQMLQAQGFLFAEDGALEPPAGKSLQMRIPSGLVPHCPVCGRPMTMNLRSDDRFVEDEGWHRAAERYTAFLRRNLDRKTLFLECCVGYNTPGIIKYSFWKMTHEWPDATYACLNYGEAYAPEEINKKSVCINEDMEKILNQLLLVP
ncbi:MAG: Sir2 silent information regulator family NAD-dependent deacetylase [Clostridiales bacterium]|nr:Sir2 silent information regulator family NAD-dependent deacetylase [Clostridiales bacterium]